MPAPAVCADDAGVTCCLEVQLPCPPLLSRFRAGSAALGIVLATTSCGFAGRVRGLSPYRAPSVVLAYPDRGVALPADKPTVVFRFAPGEADDPIDVASFRATVDGIDRTDRFRVTSREAWGTLGDTPPTSDGVTAARITTGPHTISARVCSTRGACGAVTVGVDVRPWDQSIQPWYGAGPTLQQQRLTPQSNSVEHPTGVLRNHDTPRKGLS